MKKLVVALFLFFLAFSLSAADSEFFSFNVGGMVSYNLGTQDIQPSNPFGIQFAFDNSFSGGFRFDSGMDLSLLNISISPAENTTFSLFTGQELTPNVVAFGVGFGYDFLKNSDRFYSAIGIYLDWIATNGGSYDLNGGGALSIGLKTSFGL